MAQGSLGQGAEGRVFTDHLFEVFLLQMLVETRVAAGLDPDGETAIARVGAELNWRLTAPPGVALPDRTAVRFLGARDRIAIAVRLSGPSIARRADEALPVLPSRRR